MVVGGPETWTLDRYAFLVTYLLMAVTGLGYLALMWSTVVLLGGYVTALGKKDFWCLTVISMMQAARIFNDLAELHLAPNLVSMVTTLVIHIVAELRKGIQELARTQPPEDVGSFIGGIISLPLLALCYIPAFLYGYGAIACITLALWRIGQRDYGDTVGDTSKANLMPALDIFYSLVLLQGSLYIIWLVYDFLKTRVLVYWRRYIKLPIEEGSLMKYLLDMRARCWRDPASIRGRTVPDFAADLLDSGSWEDNTLGVRLLDAFIRQGADFRWLLLPSRPKIQKLIDIMGCKHVPREARENAASIMAQLAGDINLTHFPGAMQCISSLLKNEATLAHWSREPREGTAGCNNIILQGLTILEQLASDHLNCSEICTTPGLVPKILKPLYSATLLQDISINDAWANVVNKSFKVVYSLICAPAGSNLRQEISSSKQAVSNLERILDLSGSGAGLELQLPAMHILTELVLDLSVNLATETKEKLIKKQLQIFLHNDDDNNEGEEPAAMPTPLKNVSGVKLVWLSTNSASSSAFIMKGHEEVVGRLTKMLDAKNDTRYRRCAAFILENLCTHCELDKGHFKEILLPLVLKEILPTKTHAPRSYNSPPGADEENQIVSAPENYEGSHIVSAAQGDNTEMREISTPGAQNKSSDQGDGKQSAEKDIQESFLSLILVIYNKLITADDFNEVLEKTSLRHDAFVAKLKTVVEENCQTTTVSLRIVKLCGQIAVSMMLHSQYSEQFQNQEFLKSLSKASKIMSNLESCILFAGTALALKGTVRPLLSEIEEKARQLVA
ncbi:hypothetical protein ACP4OV_015094 [Aristida adscensionis]